MFNTLHKWFYPEPQKPFDCVGYTMDLIELCLEKALSDNANHSMEHIVRSVCLEKYPHFEETEILQLTRIIKLLRGLRYYND